MPRQSNFGEDLEDNGSGFLRNVKTQNSTVTETIQLKIGKEKKTHPRHGLLLSNTKEAATDAQNNLVGATYFGFNGPLAFKRDRSDFRPFF